MATETRRWVPVQEVFDELEQEETERLWRLLAQGSDELVAPPTPPTEIDGEPPERPASV